MASPAPLDDFGPFSPTPEPEAGAAAAPAINARAFHLVLRDNPHLEDVLDHHVRPLACLGHSVALAEAFADVGPLNLDEACRLIGLNTCQARAFTVSSPCPLSKRKYMLEVPAGMRDSRNAI